MQPFAPRPATFHGVERHGEWRVKRYSIRCGQRELDAAAFSEGIAMAVAGLPSPAVQPQRPGVAFLIAHQGRTALYVVLAWWDNENELPMRVFVRDRATAGPWRAAQGSESVCVWDLEVIASERDAYVDTVLAPDLGSGLASGGADDMEAAVERYLARVAPHAAPPPAQEARIDATLAESFPASDPPSWTP